MKVLLLYFLFVNFLTFILAGYDKFQSKRHERRIPEITLFLFAFFGGTIGLLAAMFFFRHKIAKTSFVMKFCYIILVQIVIIYLKYNNKI